MIFLLEGLDKTGKSTLAEVLRKKLRCEIVKFSAPGSDAYLEYSRFLDSNNPTKDYILDRFCHGELCYGPVLRGRSQLSFEDLRYLELRLLSFGVVPIYCFTDVNHICENMVNRREESTKINQVIPIVKNFNALLADSTCLDWLHYNFKLQKLKAFVKKLCILKRPKSLTKLQLKNWLGPSNPKVVFVLDKKNINLADKHILDSISGRFLLNCLWKTQHNWFNKFAYTNQARLNLSLINGRRVIALGQKANNKLLIEGFKTHRQASHPQFAKRFYGKNGKLRYEKELVNALIS